MGVFGVQADQDVLALAVIRRRCRQFNWVLEYAVVVRIVSLGCINRTPIRLYQIACSRIEHQTDLE